MSGRETGGVNDEVKFCPECGHGVGQEDEAPVEPYLWRPPQVPERPRPRIFGAVLGALIVWTIIVGLFATFVFALASAGTP